MTESRNHFKLFLANFLIDVSDYILVSLRARDLLFRRFVGVSLQGVPDCSTIWRFRNKLEKNELLGLTMDEVNSQIAAQSLIIKQGEVSIIGASVIEAMNTRPCKSADGENTQDFRGRLQR